MYDRGNAPGYIIIDIDKICGTCNVIRANECAIIQASDPVGGTNDYYIH